MATFDEAFNTALANLRGSGVSPFPLPQVQPMTFNLPSYKPINVGAGAVGNFASPGNSSPSGTGFWKGLGWDLLSALNGVGGLVTDQIADWTDGNPNWHDLLGINQLGHLGQGQWAEWHNGQKGLGDIPLLGAFVGAGKTNKSTHDIFGNIGYNEAEADPNKGWNFWQHRKGNFDIGDLGEFTGDVLLDPTTYLTFGAAGAAKSGARASAKEATEQLIKAGLKGSLDNAAERVGAKVTEEAIAKGLSLEAANKLGLEATARARVAIDNAGKTARFGAQNALINFDLPFTDITRQIGTKPDFLKISDNLIGETGKTAVLRELAGRGLDSSILKTAYGVEDAAQMTSQQLAHFMENIRKVNIAEDAKTIFKPVTDEILTYRPFDIADITKNITDPTERGYVENLFRNLDRAHTTPQILGDSRTLLNDLADVRGRLPEDILKRADELLKFAGDAPGMVDQAGTLKSIDELLQASDALKTAGHSADLSFAPFTPTEIKVPNSARTLQDAQGMFDLNRFAQDMGGNSLVGRWLGERVKALNPRTVGAADAFVNEAGGKIRDAEGFVRSNQGFSKNELRAVQRLAKGLPEADLRKVPYLIEDNFPAGATRESFLADIQHPEQVQKVADYLKGIFERMAGRETKAGALQDVRSNYFPHVLANGRTKADLQALLNDPEIAKYLGRSSSNRFAKAREGFDTFAEWDNALASLKAARSKVTDPEALAKLDERIAQLETLFERDPIAATASRMAKSIQTTAMSQLQGQLREMGVLRLPSDIAKDGAGSLTKDYVRLVGENAKVAQQLGLPPGTAIHREVLNGLQKVPYLFTDAGINKFVENMTAATNIWKNLVTTYVPSHHIFNMFGNIANTTLAGVPLESYRQAGSVLVRLKQLGLDQLTETERKLLQRAADHGITGGGQLLDVVDPLRLAGAGDNILQRVERAVAGNKYATTMRNFGDSIEDLSRLATFIHGEKVYRNSGKAADLVRKFLFNYGELTNADRTVKLVVPFWNWTKNNLPLQLSQFLQQPRYYATLRKLQDGLNVDNQADPKLPSYIAEDYVRLPGGNFWNPRIPANDLFRALNGPLGFGLNTVSPAIKIPFELGLNKQVFNGAPIDPYKASEGSYHSAPLTKYLLNQTGVFNRAADFANPDANLLQNMANLFGLKTTKVDPAKVQRGRAYDERLERQGRQTQ